MYRSVRICSSASSATAASDSRLRRLIFLEIERRSVRHPPQKETRIMSSRVLVAGVGMIPFVKPSAAEPYTIMGPKAVRLALLDAGVGYEEIQQVVAGYVYG